MKHLILLVEDNPDDLVLLQRIIARTEPDNETVIHIDISTALAWLHESGRDHHNMPVLILLDLAFPQIDAVGFLQRLRSDSLTRNTPVVVYSNKADSQVIAACTASGCNSYVCKPARYADFAETTRQIIQYWLTINAVPHYGMT